MRPGYRSPGGLTGPFPGSGQAGGRSQPLPLPLGVRGTQPAAPCRQSSVTTMALEPDAGTTGLGGGGADVRSFAATEEGAVGEGALREGRDQCPWGGRPWCRGRSGEDMQGTQKRGRCSLLSVSIFSVNQRSGRVLRSEGGREPAVKVGGWSERRSGSGAAQPALEVDSVQGRLQGRVSGPRATAGRGRG